MCCSRGHYPVETGLWLTDATATHVHVDGDVEGDKASCGDYDHRHIILPGDLHTACIGINSYDDDSLEVRVTAARYRAEHSTNLVDNEARYISQFRIWAPVALTNDLCDLIAVGIAEGYRLDNEWLFEEIVKEWAKDHEVKAEFWGPSLELFTLKPPEALEYHEWLVLQAQKELQSKQANLT